MDEVSDGRSVGRVPVSAKDVQDGPVPSENGGNHWDKIAWLLPRIFTQNSGLVATNLFISCQLLRLNSARLVHTGLKYRNAVMHQDGSDLATSARMDSHMNFERP
jgi:hypothetical protein